MSFSKNDLELIKSKIILSQEIEKKTDYRRILKYRCLRKKRPLPNFNPRAYLGLQNGATNAEKHGESEFTAQNAPKPSKKLDFLKKRN